MRLLIATCLTLAGAPLWAQDAPTFSDLDLLQARANLLDGSVDEAVAVLKPAAEAGNLRAQALYGTVWEWGDTGVVDLAEAVRWYEVSAAQGHPQAMMLLAGLYRYGPGEVGDKSQADPAKAVEWYQHAIALDHIPAYGELGDMLFFG